MPFTSSSSSKTSANGTVREAFGQYSSPHTPLLLKRGVWGGAILLVLAIVVVYAVCDPATSAFFPRCPMKQLTGLSCPGCGFQRAFHAVLGGHLHEALSYNWFFVLSLPYAAAVIIAWLLKALGKAPRIVSVLEHHYGIYAYLTLFCLWFVVRNIYDI